MPQEAPTHQATVKSFWMDAPEVTVYKFARFVKATGYVTASEAKWEYAARGGLKGKEYSWGDEL